MTAEPLVSCICPTTRTRAQWWRKMLDCFQAQTYPHKELVIAADMNAQEAHVFAPYASRVIGSFGVRLGAKRNLLCEHSRGELIAHFDDDDWSHSERLSIQVTQLLESGKSVIGLGGMKFTDGTRWWRYHDLE